ncbi:DSS1/SEM1 family-domain-containing protein [Tribonema minus]|uniref:DSS1/SEM1 family-domain-containing protein n=1 Tax=Tribonema minus TaxID=303371 RepID=A0A835ZAT5_9STRA|nr:DSS1/SEM1 family-domain-containing protein [Tribonema minus]
MVKEPTSTMADKKEQVPVVEGLEEDDEFEEFEEENWSAAQEDTADAAQWQEDWDDDALDEDFCSQLRQELQQNATTAA